MSSHGQSPTILFCATMQDILVRKGQTLPISFLPPASIWTISLAGTRQKTYGGVRRENGSIGTQARTLSCFGVNVEQIGLVNSASDECRKWIMIHFLFRAWFTCIWVITKSWFPVILPLAPLLSQPRKTENKHNHPGSWTASGTRSMGGSV